MAFFAKFFGSVRQFKALREEVLTLREEHDRLVIEFRALTRRQTQQEAELDEFAHKVHGRAGGRPRKLQAVTALQAPMSGATDLFPRQE